MFSAGVGVVFFKLLESESGLQKCWSRSRGRFFKTAGVGVRSRNPKKSSNSTTLINIEGSLQQK